MNKTDETILVFSFRYALGRISTAPSIVAGVLINKWEELDQVTQDQIKHDIRTSIRLGDAGMECDVKTWQAVLKL